MTILDKIIKTKHEDVALAKLLYPIKELEKTAIFNRSPYSISQSISLKKEPAIISEFKRKSPSKPIINLHATNAIVVEYEKAGASAVSILTDKDYFGGSNDDVISIREKVGIPILRKEFIVDEYQIIEAKSIGADFILLIAEVLTKQEIISFTDLAHSLGMEVLMEMHDEIQIDKLFHKINLVGINNRNLKTFETSIENSFRILPLLPKEMIKVSESGIYTEDQVLSLYEAGFDAFLIGENFMKQEDPGQALREFRSNLIKQLA
ncbi:MAG: hypothetical protein RLZZ546_451 [Bacteroidota bacterium]|jgi:indole-3-glycerol phosphate synthase